MLHGKKAMLVPLEKEDLPKTLTWVNDSELNSKMLRVLPVTQLDQEKWYQDIVSDSAKIVFAIKTQDGAKHIGNTGLYHIDWIHRRAEFWILIGERDYWKRGIGAEIVSLIQQFTFNNLHLNKLYLNVGRDNNEAIGLYKKLNFTEEGVLKEHYFIEGKYIDVITMSILKRDFNYEK
jgi:RimJ/RimL family protein N-acetyltransferase